MTDTQQELNTTGRYYERTFDIGAGDTEYEKYLKTVKLLQLQKPAEQTISHQELLFQVTHQSSELWMKTMLDAIGRAITALDADNAALAGHHLRLVTDIQGVLLHHVDLLSHHMNVMEYAKIRTVLGQGSGMESPGFNWLLDKTPQLWLAFKGYLDRQHLSVRQIYVEYQAHLEAYNLAELLVDYDDRFHKWRSHHFDLVHRTIGTEANSLKGLSSKILQKGAIHRFFTELWQIRNTLTDEQDIQYGRKEGSE